MPKSTDTIKIVVIGDCAVGKISILKRYMDGTLMCVDYDKISTFENFSMDTIVESKKVHVLIYCLKAVHYIGYGIPFISKSKKKQLIILLCCTGETGFMEDAWARGV